MRGATVGDRIKINAISVEQGKAAAAAAALVPEMCSRKGDFHFYCDVRKRSSPSPPSSSFSQSLVLEESDGRVQEVLLTVLKYFTASEWSTKREKITYCAAPRHVIKIEALPALAAGL